MNPGEFGAFGIFALFVLAAVALAVFSFLAEKKRREALAAEAAAAGLAFAPDQDRGIAVQYGFLNALNAGENRYGANRFYGAYGGEKVDCFDFHYETQSGSGKNRRTDHHWHHVYALELPVHFPELRIGPENVLTRIARNFGYPSIDFESHEFSREFLVQSPDKKFAYDICHPRMIEYLLENRGIRIEVEGRTMAVVAGGRMTPGTLVGQLDRLLALRRMVPGYLLSGSP